MKKTITILFLALGVFLFAGQGFGQTAAQSSAPAAKLSTSVQNGVRIFVTARDKSEAASNRVDFVNTTTEDIVFTWSVLDKTGKTIFTSHYVELKSGATFTPDAGNASALGRETTANEIQISVKK